MRCFIAVDIPDERIIIELDKMCSMFDLQGVKRVEKENLHITLRFLGEISESALASVISSLKRVSFKKFQAHISGLGAFPSIKNPRVVWAGVKEGFAELIQLHSIIEKEFLDSGLRFEKEEYHPHVTLARIKDRRSIKKILDLLEQNKEKDFGSFEVKSFSLKQSILTPRGPIYKDIEVFELWT